MRELLKELEKKGFITRDYFSFKPYYNVNFFNKEQYEREVEVEKQLIREVHQLKYIEAIIDILISSDPLLKSNRIEFTKKLIRGNFDKLIEAKFEYYSMEHIFLFRKYKYVARLIFKYFKIIRF